MRHLRECPFCGEDEMITVSQLPTEEYYVFCEVCGARSGPAHERYRAIKNWNGRCYPYA